MNNFLNWAILFGCVRIDNWFDMPLSDTFFAACFIASEVSSSAFEKYAHIYVTALLWLNTGWMSILAFHAYKLWLKESLIKYVFGSCLKWIWKYESIDIDKAWWCSFSVSL